MRKFAARAEQCLMAAVIGLAVMGLALAAGPGKEPPGGRNPQAPAAIDSLSFLIGDWTLAKRSITNDGEIVKGTATLRARWAMNGYAILVEELHPRPDSEFASAVLYTVDPETGGVIGVSVNTLGNRKAYRVEVDGDELLIRQGGEMFGGRQGFNRWRIHGISEARYELELSPCDASSGQCDSPIYSYLAERIR